MFLAGSIIIDFDILPGDSTVMGYIPVVNATARLRSALDLGELTFTLTDGTVIVARSLSTFTAPDGKSYERHVLNCVHLFRIYCLSDGPIRRVRCENLVLSNVHNQRRNDNISA